MNIFQRAWSWITGSDRKIRGSYDAAQTHDENKNHWSWTDSQSANAANSPEVRKKLRERARYEVKNNPNASGLISTIANDLIGRGPRLQLTLPGQDSDAVRKASRQVQAAFAAWSRAVGLADKLRVLEESRRVDGEGFLFLLNSQSNWPKTPVLLNLVTIEAEQVDNYYPAWWNPFEVDGIRFDQAGNPTEYSILKQHPGSNYVGINAFDAEWYPASRVLHWFKPRRPGQARGVSELAPSLELFAQLRRYGKAVLTAAETAAMLAGIMTSDDMPTPDDEAEYGPKAFDRYNLVPGTLLQLPPRSNAHQFKPEQPTTTYGDFKRENLGDAGRPLGATLNVTTGNSSGYNYSSGRLDHAIYHRSLIVDRDRMRYRVLDPLFYAWLDEALLLPNFLPAGLPPVTEWQWEWYWDAFVSIDPVKDATATEILLRTGMTTYAEEYAAFGQDWEEQIPQRIREMALIKRLCEQEGLDPSTVSSLITPVAAPTQEAVSAE